MTIFGNKEKVDFATFSDLPSYAAIFFGWFVFFWITYYVSSGYMNL